MPGKSILADGVVSYDILILATGVTHAYYGHDAWAEHAPGLKTLKDALAIRQRVLLAFEIAEREPDPDRRRAWLTFVIVGGGPTGVELAGTLAEVSRQTLARDFRHINTASARVILVEAGPRVLPAYSEELSHSAALQLEKLGVAVWTGMQVTGIDADGVSIAPERIHARTVLWAAGVAASPLAHTLGVPLDRAGRVLVQPDLTIPGHDDVYVHRRPGVDHDRWQPGAGCGTGCIAGGRSRGPEYHSRPARAATTAVSLSRQGDAGDHRPRRRRRQGGPDQGLGLLRLAALAVRPHLFPDRLSQPPDGYDSLGVVLRHLRSRRTVDYRAAQAAAPGTAVAAPPTRSTPRRPRQPPDEPESFLLRGCCLGVGGAGV